MPKTKTSDGHPITRDIPLPGHYPCLTLQINVTRYASGSLGRMVAVLREPSSGVEVERRFQDTSDWMSIADSVEHALATFLKDMKYLQEGIND